MLLQIFLQTSSCFSSVCGDLGWSQNDRLTKQILYWSLFSTKTVFCLNMQNFGFYYLWLNSPLIYV